MTDQTISHYRILEKLGEGGMGVVYKAEDTKLRRTVALKFLPPRATENRERFIREAQAAAALNHSNICTVFEIDEQHGFLAMELIEGQSLKDKIAARPLPLKEALDIAMQACSGLQAAHEKGVVHRDIKPANLMLTAQGHVKIMDFGLAQVGDRTRITKTGSSIGTPAYMSPEQVKGEAVDRRTDIWSLGVVLYEMLSGRLPFGGETEPAVTYAIVHTEPEPLTAVRSGLPLALDRIVRKALAKNAATRYQHIEDLLVDLRVMEQAQGGEARPARWVWVVAVAAGIGLLSLGIWNWRAPAPPVSPPVVRYSVELPASHELPIDFGLPVVVAVEPKGAGVFYVAQQGGTFRLYRRKRDEFQASAVPGAEGAMMPFFSPDGQWVGFASGGELKKVSLAGGPPVRICPAPNPVGASWGMDNTIVFGPAWSSGLMKVSADGGIPTTLTTLNAAAGETSHRDPHVLPDGRVLFTAVERNQHVRIDAFLPATGKRQVLTEGGNSVYLPTGHLVFARGGTLFAAPLDLQKLTFSAQPVPVLEGVRSDGVKTYFSVARDGTLAYVPAARSNSKLVWVDRKGQVRSISDEPRRFYHPRLSPDGARFLVGSAGDIWLYELGRGTRARLAAGSRPIWSADGRHVVFFRGGVTPGLFSVPADGGSEPQLLLVPQGSATNVFPLAWSADGRLLAFSNPSSETSRDIWVQPRGGKPTPFLTSPLDERAGMFSPDGRWLVYALKQTGREEEVYVKAYPGPGGTWLISAGGGMEPVWSRDGSEIFYRTLDGNRMMTVAVQTRPTFSASPPRMLFEGRYSRAQGSFWSDYDVSRNGQEFLMLAAEDAVGETQINVVLNWFEDLKGRLASK